LTVSLLALGTLFPPSLLLPFALLALALLRVALLSPVFEDPLDRLAIISAVGRYRF
jgi:hypothetical protein